MIPFFPLGYLKKKLNSSKNDSLLPTAVLKEKTKKLKK
jgi:hypothetical protein